MSNLPAEDPGTSPDVSPTYRELPPATQAAEWDKALPGAAERILRLVEADFEQQQRNQHHQQRMDIVNLWFRAVGIAVGAAGVVGYLMIAKYLVDHGAAGAAAGLLGGGVTAFGALFWGNQYRNSR